MLSQYVLQLSIAASKADKKENPTTRVKIIIEPTTVVWAVLAMTNLTAANPEQGMVP